ncbi:MAG: hypothetical protein ACR2L8_17815 [Solirubrobacteraceae bacterium]
MPAEPSDPDEAAREADEARRLRAHRDAALTPAERLARVHELCRQLAGIRPVARHKR